MKTLILTLFLVLVLAIMLYKLWYEQDSVATMRQLNIEIAKQQQENNKLLQHNQILIAEVFDLKHGSDAIESRARIQLGMIKQGEQFYQIVEPNPKR